jgi:hypothetical protein
MPETSWITGAGKSYLTAASPVFEHLSNCKIDADEIYEDSKK